MQVLVDALRKTKSGVSGRSQKRQRTAAAASRRSGGSDLWTSGDNEDSDTQSGDSSYEYGERWLHPGRSQSRYSPVEKMS